MTVTFPCTITGLRWNLSSIIANNVNDVVTWAIVHVREGEVTNTMNLTDAGSFYNPEQNVLCYGIRHMHGNTAGGGMSGQWEGATKTMRKVMAGDRLVLCVRGYAAGNKIFQGIVQFFCKS